MYISRKAHTSRFYCSARLTHILTLLLFCLCLPQVKAQNLKLPFLEPTDPDLDPTCDSSANVASWLNNTRTFTFNLPQDFSQIDMGIINTNVDGSGSGVTLDWPDSRTTMVYEDPSDPQNSAWGGVVGSYIIVQVDLEDLNGVDTTDEAAASLNGSENVIYQEDGTTTFQVKGATLHNFSLPYTIWIEDYPSYNSSSDPDPGGFYDATSIDEQILHFIIDWGSPDSYGDHQFIHVSFDVNVLVSIGDLFSDFSDFPMTNACSELLGGSPTVEDYISTVVAQIQSQLANNNFLAGAPPENLVLYDNSLSDSIDPSILSAGLYSVPTNATDSQALQAFATAINQYDAGVAYGLPTRGLNPPTPGYTYTPGGNSCGVICLRLALNQVGITLNPTNVYGNVMVTNGWITLPNVTNNFDWWSAQSWLNGATNNNTLKRAFSPILRLPLTEHCNLQFATNALQITKEWAIVDAALAKKFSPILIRTDLGVSQAPGGGHVILLVGEGNSEYVQQAYGTTSGDYYVVADPAGHYFANTNSLQHYGQVQALMNDNVGINQGGWYAIYPKALLQQRITAINGQARFIAEGINLVSNIQTDAHSPVAMHVTDGIGDWTGIQTNGAVVMGIPNSAYDSEWADEEESGVGGYVTNGAKTVIIDSPQVGNYQAQIVGTGNGTYALDWSYTGGGHDFSGYVTNSIVVGQQVNYNLGIVPPSLAIMAINGQVVFSWTTNVPNFVLQQATNLKTNVWLPISQSPKILSGQFVITNNIAGASAFFRLSALNP